MSDVEDSVYYEDYGNYNSADEYGTADDLAEHVLPSPVWVSYDPDWFIDSPTTDCEEDSRDEYYDESTEATRKRERKDVESANRADSLAQTELRKKRRKLEDTREIPELKLPEQRRIPREPTVVWKSREARLCPSPSPKVVSEGQGKSVAILKDWRERLNNVTSEQILFLASQPNLETNTRATVGPLELDDVRENGDSDPAMPPLPPTSGDCLTMPTKGSGSTTYEKSTSSKPAPTIPGSQLLSAAERKCKSTQTDVESRNGLAERSTKSSAVESTEPAVERLNGFLHQLNGKRKAHDELPE